MVAVIIRAREIRQTLGSRNGQEARKKWVIRQTDDIDWFRYIFII